MPVAMLIRHAENDYVKTNKLAGRLPGVHLNKHGNKQAQTLAARLAKTPIKAIYSSPLERAMETAQALAASLNLAVIPHDGLLEVDFGDWQDQSLKALRRLKLWKIVQGSPSQMRFPNGESFAEAQLRVVQALDKIRQQHDPKDLFVCVSHSDLIKLAVAYHIGLPLDSFQRLQVGTASISTLMLGESSSALLNLNVDYSLTVA